VIELAAPGQILMAASGQVSMSASRLVWRDCLIWQLMVGLLFAPAGAGHPPPR